MLYLINYNVKYIYIDFINGEAKNKGGRKKFYLDFINGKAKTEGEKNKAGGTTGHWIHKPRA